MKKKVVRSRAEIRVTSNLSVDEFQRLLSVIKRYGIDKVKRK